jgi:hypothetical protein
MADLIGPMPVLELANGATVSFEAVDPTSGANVSGVLVSTTAIAGIDRTPADEEEQESTIVNTAVLIPGPVMT